MAQKGYTFCYYVSGHGFGHATRVNQIITELLTTTATMPTTACTTTTATAVDTTAPTATVSTTIPHFKDASSGLRRRQLHTIYIVSDAPRFIFQDVIALGAIYRNAKVDAGVVQPLAYSVDRHKTIEGVKSFLARREEMIQHEVSWLAEVGADCVLADAPFLPCAAAAAYGIPACLITNFTFDEVYRFLREGDDFDQDVIACADAALEDYKKASLLLRLPGSIDIPSFADEVLVMTEASSQRSPIDWSDDDSIKEAIRGHPTRTVQPLLTPQPSISEMDDPLDGDHPLNVRQDSALLGTSMGDITPEGVMSPESFRTGASSPDPSGAEEHLGLEKRSRFPSPSKMASWTRRAIDVPMVVRMAVNTREDVMRMLGMDEHTIATKKMVLVSFGGQRLKQGWGNPLPEGWVGVICGLPVEHELPEGFYRSPHGVYVPDLTRAADIVIGKLGYGTCSESIAHNKPLIYVSRPQFIEEHGLTRMMQSYGLPVEMTAEEFETGHWQRSILEADRQYMAREAARSRKTTLEAAAQETKSVISEMKRTRRQRTESVSSMSAFQPRAHKMARLSPIEGEEVEVEVEGEEEEEFRVDLGRRNVPKAEEIIGMSGPSMSLPLEDRRIANNGGEVCARLVEEFMAQLEEDDSHDGF
ncbi:hypothetical protein BGW38_004106 [Lunasporangiospora selenospora]|uniref:L-arabinokinase n=1 Tax=Lunasporangiospora selenospora TaxID=979761 RepID=A0A9P6KCD3_9FUNG|nr:hypothetical protein BGW38_004106 [Lunasporangiospora selenospora]